MYTIEKNVPIPEHRGLTGILKTMEIGDSFIFEKDKLISIRSQVSRISKLDGKKYTIMNIDGVSRLWRIK